MSQYMEDCLVTEFDPTEFDPTIYETLTSEELDSGTNNNEDNATYSNHKPTVHRSPLPSDTEEKKN